MPFENGLWVEPDKETIDSITVKPSYINLTFLRSNSKLNDYEIVYSIILSSAEYDFSDTNVRRRVLKKTLTKALISKIKEDERRYISVKSNSGDRVIFVFNFKKWFADSTKPLQTKSYMSKFERRIKLKKTLPSLVYYNYDAYLGKFISKKFKQFVPNLNIKKSIKGMLPRAFELQNRIKYKDLFNYEYDYQANEMILKLKNEYLMMIMFAVTTAAKLTDTFVKIDFTKRVSRINSSKGFNSKKWKTFIKKKFI